jgi:hypothetical protein
MCVVELHGLTSASALVLQVFDVPGSGKPCIRHLLQRKSQDL